MNKLNVDDEARTLTRYDLKYDENTNGDLTDAVLDEVPNGEYVKYVDAIAALTRSRQRAIEVAIEIAREEAFERRMAYCVLDRLETELRKDSDAN